MAKRRVPPDKARAAIMGSGFYTRIVPSEANRKTCSKCGAYSTMIGQDGECLKCLLERRKAAREASV